MNQFRFRSLVVFIGVLAVILGLWWISQNHPNPQKEVTVQQQPPQDGKAAEERARYRLRYLNRGFARKPGLKTVAVAASEDGRPVRSIARALADHLEFQNLTVYSSFFKPAFFADGLFSQIFGGSIEPIENLELTNTLDALLLAQERVRYSTNAPAGRISVTAHTRLHVMFLPFATMRPEQNWRFTANGAGFDPGQARRQAEESLIKQIGDDTNIVLVPASPDDQEYYP